MTAVYVIMLSKENKLKVKMIKVERTYRDLTVTTANLIDKYKFEPTIVFCEDKNTLSLEREVVKVCGGSLFCQITTLNRFIYKLVPIEKVCSKHTQALIIKKILTQVSSQLKVFKNLNGYSIAGGLAELISQLKSAKVTPEKLMQSASGFNGVFKNKIEDIALVFGEYEKYLQEKGLLDINNKFSLLVNALEKMNLGNFRVIISGFQSVTAQTAQAFEIISQRAKSVDFICLGGKNFYTNEVYNFAKGLSLEENKVTQEEHERYRLLDFLYNETEKEGLYSDKIRIFEYGDETEELLCVAESIKNQVLNGARYKDFMITCANFIEVKPFLKKVLADYEIPHYLEDNYKMSDHPLIRAIGMYIDLYSRPLIMSQYKKFVRSSALFSDREFVDKYLLHLNKYAYSERAIQEKLEEDAPEFEEFRKFSLSFSQLSKKAKASDYVHAILDLMERAKVGENLEVLAKKLKEEDDLEGCQFITTGIEKTIQLLQEINQVLGEEEILAKDFKALLLSGASYMEFSVIPQRDDRVYIGDFSSCKFRFAKHLFVTGLSSDYPTAMQDTALLNDTDLKRLDKIKVVIDPKIEIVNKRNKEDLCVTLGAFDQSLTLSYASYYFGEEKMPCEVISYACQAFSDKTKSVEPRKNSLIRKAIMTDGTNEQKLDLIARKNLTEKVALKNFATSVSNYKYRNGVEDFSAFYTASSGSLKESADEVLSSVNSTLVSTIDGMGEMFFDKNKVSVSVAEKYFACPYANFLSNALRLQDDQDGQVKVYEFGTVMHGVCEQFIKLLIEDAISSEEEVKIISNQLIEGLLRQPEYARYKKKAQNQELFNLLKQEAERVLLKMYRDSQKTDFKPKYVELGFGYGGEKNGIKLNAKSGDYEVRGKIDRVDTCENLVRIIDYKSGRTKDGSVGYESEEMLYSGKKLQLYLYLNLFLDEGLSPSGVYYAPINDDYRKDTEDNPASLQGKTVADEEIFAKTDNTMGEDGKSEIIGLVYSRGKLNQKTTITEKRLKAYAEYARMLTAKAVDDIKGGLAIVSPTKDACEYCAYKGICGFDKEKFGTEREVIKVSGASIEKLVFKDEK